MKERPILFNGPMVRAILEGRKTVTRRVIRPSMRRADTQFELHQQPDGSWRPLHTFDESCMDAQGTEHPIACPLGQVGDRLWVRESWQDVHPLQVTEGRYTQLGQAGIPGPPGVTYQTIYRADGPYPQVYHCFEHPYRCLQPDPAHSPYPAEGGYTGWTPSIHMPRWASRILLEVTAVRVERLQDITAEQAEAEGVDAAMCRQYLETAPSRHECKAAAVHGFAGLWASTGGDWASNPWVWVVEFKRVQPEALTAQEAA